MIRTALPRPFRGVAAAFVAGSVLAGCAADRFATRTDICARAIDAFNPADAKVVTGRVAKAGENGVRIEYRVERAGRARMRSLTCRFRDSSEEDARRIEAIETEAGRVSEPSSILLERFLFVKA